MKMVAKDRLTMAFDQPCSSVRIRPESMTSN